MFRTRPQVMSKFYSDQVKMEELCTGFLHKSPASAAIMKKTKSWKRRFFVLSKSSEDVYQWTYHTNEERRDKPLGHIDLSKISLLFACPESHQMWDWMQKHFKCVMGSVLFLRVEEKPKNIRDYFLIGANSDEAHKWLKALISLNVLKSKSLKSPQSDDAQERSRSASEPCNMSQSQIPDQAVRYSAPEITWSFSPPQVEEGHYDYPRKFCNLNTTSQELEVADSDDDAGESTEEHVYMLMSEVPQIIQQEPPDTDEAQSSGTSSCPDDSSSFQDLCKHTANLDKDEDKKRTNGELDNSESLLLIKDHILPGEMEKPSLNESEIPKVVEKEICVSQKDLKDSLIFTQEEGKPCVSDCRQVQFPCLFHKGDQILAFNDLLIDTVEEIQTYLKRLSKDEVKLTIRRLPGSQPLLTERCT